MTNVAKALKIARAALNTIGTRDLNAVQKIETTHGVIEYSGWGRTAYVVLKRADGTVTGYATRA